MEQVAKTDCKFNENPMSSLYTISIRTKDENTLLLTLYREGFIIGEKELSGQLVLDNIPPLSLTSGISEAIYFSPNSKFSFYKKDDKYYLVTQ